jgi:hypothetical protein
VALHTRRRRRVERGEVAGEDLKDGRQVERGQRGLVEERSVADRVLLVDGRGLLWASLIAASTFGSSAREQNASTAMPPVGILPARSLISVLWTPTFAVNASRLRCSVRPCPPKTSSWEPLPMLGRDRQAGMDVRVDERVVVDDDVAEDAVPPAVLEHRERRAAVAVDNDVGACEAESRWRSAIGMGSPVESDRSIAASVVFPRPFSA